MYVNELTRHKIASLSLGVLDAEMCRAKYKYKRRKLLLVTRVSRSRRSSDDRLERETRVSSNNFLLLYLYACMYACMHACMHVCMYVLNA